MKFRKVCLFVAAMFCALQGYAYEFQDTSRELSELDGSSDRVWDKKFWFGSASILPGIGVSWRVRKSVHFGHSLDCKIGGVPPLYVGVSGEYNALFYFRSREISPYVSCGGGVMGAMTIAGSAGSPYIPVRVGMQLENAMLDLGVQIFILRKDFLFTVPLPEARFGFSF